MIGEYVVLELSSCVFSSIDEERNSSEFIG
jgi:hypothetical protein